MFDKERFHNALALSLGYERIVKDKRITIQVDDSGDPWVTLKFQGRPEIIRIKASGEANAALVRNDKSVLKCRETLYKKSLCMGSGSHLGPS